MEPETHILLLGRPSSADSAIVRAMQRCWPDSQMHQAADAPAAIEALAGSSARPRPIAPDLVIVKLRSAQAVADDISALRAHALLRNAVFAAFLEGEAASALRCMRGAGFAAVLTEPYFEMQVHDLKDAVVTSWIAPRDVDCSERYFCPVCEICVVAARAGANIPAGQARPFLVWDRTTPLT